MKTQPVAREFSGQSRKHREAWLRRVLAGALLVAAAACAQDEKVEDDDAAAMPGELGLDSELLMPRDLTKDAESVHEAFRQSALGVSVSVVNVLTGNCPVALGTVVGSNGLIVTKASLLGNGTNAVSCRLADGRRMAAVLAGIDDEQDLALLKIGAVGLKPVVWACAAGAVPPPAGMWVITPGPTGAVEAVGVVSAAPRATRMHRRDHPRGFLGVQLDEAGTNTVRIARVIHGLAAAQAGVKTGDEIRAIDGVAMGTVEQVIDKLSGTAPGTEVHIDVSRDDDTVSLSAILGKAPVHSPELRWGGGPFSERRFGFPEVLLHDTILRPEQCGGPLIDIDGRVVGLNIARALRVASYALLPDTVRRTVARLETAMPAAIKADPRPLSDMAATGEPSSAGEGAGTTNAAAVDALAQGAFELERLWLRAIREGDGDTLATLTDKLVAKYPEKKGEVMMRTAEIYLGMLGEDKRGYEMARALTDETIESAPSTLNELAWFILTEQSLTRPDLETAFQLARLAVKRSRGRDSAILDTLARAHFELGRLDTAIKAEKRALKRADRKTRAVVEDTLRRYQRAKTSI